MQMQYYQGGGTGTGPPPAPAPGMQQQCGYGQGPGPGPQYQYQYQHYQAYQPPQLQYQAFYNQYQYQVPVQAASSFPPSQPRHNTGSGHSSGSGRSAGSGAHSKKQSGAAKSVSTSPSAATAAAESTEYSSAAAAATAAADEGAATKQVFYCESCEKEFSVHDAFVAHQAMHEPCGHPSCKFSGTKKVVNAHYLSVHGTFSGTGYKDIDVDGQSFRVLMGTSPEEVEQWRAARRMRFPSAANVSAKLEHTNKLSAAGGVLPKTASSAAQNRNQKRKISKEEDTQLSAGNAKQTRVASSNSNEVQPEPEAAVSAEREEGVQEGAVPDPAHVDAAEAEAAGGGDERDKGHNQDKSRRVCYNFFKGMCKEGDTCPLLHTTEVTVCKFFLKGNCRSGKRCRNMHDREAAATAASKRKDTVDDIDDDNRKRKKNGLYLPKPLAGGTRGTLLRKLLQDSIAEEENIILQCLRHFASKLVNS